MLLSRIFDVLGVILSGPLADLFKRKTVAYAAVAITTLLSYPFVLAILAKRVLLVMAVECLMSSLDWR